MYTDKNFKTKKQLKEQVAAYNAAVAALAAYMRTPDVSALTHALNVTNLQAEIDRNEVTIYSPGMGTPKTNGTESVEGPHYPQPHTWYAQVTLKDGVVVKVT